MKKIDNLWKFWGKHYDIRQVEHTKFRRTIYQVIVTVEHHDGSKIDFNKEWDQIKKLADRQAFYPIPLNNDNGRGTGVALIRKESLYGMDKRLMEIHDMMSGHYWTVQGDPESLNIKFELRELSKEVKSIIRGIRDMESNLSEALRVEMYDNFVVLGMFLDYKIRISQLHHVALRSEKIENQTYRKIEAIWKEYVY